MFLFYFIIIIIFLDSWESSLFLLEETKGLSEELSNENVKCKISNKKKMKGEDKIREEEIGE